MKIAGAIRHDGNFYATDGAERWFVEVRRARAGGLPFVDGERVKVELDVSGDCYAAGIRTTPEIVYITYDAYTIDGEKVRLVDALAGFARNDQVQLDVEGKYIKLSRAETSDSRQMIGRREAVKNVSKDVYEANLAAEAAESFARKDVKDARSRTLRFVVSRRGQPRFRSAVLTAYRGRCAITGCDLTPALEAAHIYPYRGPETNVVMNGILLRSDLHTLYDLGLFAIHPEELTIIASPELMQSAYAEIAGVRINVPKKRSQWPSREALAAQREWAGL